MVTENYDAAGFHRVCTDTLFGQPLHASPVHCRAARSARLARIGSFLWAAVGGCTFASKFPLGCLSSGESGVIAVMHDEMCEEHQDEYATKGDDDRCAGRRIQLDAEPAAEC